MESGLEAADGDLGARALVAELGIIPEQEGQGDVVLESVASDYSNGDINFNQMCRFKVPANDPSTQLRVLLFDAASYPHGKRKVGMVLLNVGQLYGHANTRIKQLCAIRLDKGMQPKVRRPCEGVEARTAGWSVQALRPLGYIDDMSSRLQRAAASGCNDDGSASCLHLDRLPSLADGST